MNILFVNYGDFTTNSLNHIGGFANSLCASGHACAVAVTGDKDTLRHIANPLFIPVTQEEALTRPGLFPDGRPADIIHAWTPRECVRRFTLAYQRAALATSSSPARLIIHLEDNEHFLLESYTGQSLAELREADAASLAGRLSDSLSHPLRADTFLRLADGVTHIVAKLADFIPPGTPTLPLFPGVDFSLYRPDLLDAAARTAARTELGLRKDEKVIVFTGSNTFANEPEMRDLHLAVAILNQRGIPTRLVRTGFNSPRFIDNLPADVRRHVLDLGFIEKSRLPALLALADVLVQPGRPGPFNDYRLPSKLPEFLASGRPVILPPTNLASLLRDGHDAIFLPPSGTPDDIADACQRLFADPTLCAKLGRHGAEFAHHHFDLAANTRNLSGFYLATQERPSATDWSLTRTPTVTDLSLLAKRVSDHPTKDTTTADFGAQVSLLTLAVRQLEQDIDQVDRQRDAILERERLTQQHVTNLENLRDAILERERLAQQHAKNLEDLLATSRQHSTDVEAQRDAILERERLAQQHAKNLEDLLATFRQHATDVETQRDAILERERLAQQHAKNLEDLLATFRQHAVNLEALLATSRQHAADVEAQRDAILERERLAQQHAKNLEDARRITQDHADHLTRELAEHKLRREQADTLLRSARQQVNAYQEALLKADVQIADLQRDLAQATEEASANRLEIERLQIASRDTEALLRAQHAAELAATNDKLAQTEALLRSRDEKIATIHTSFSWRVTAPFRALRRALFGRPASPKTSPLLIGNIDQPADWSRIPPRLEIRGWTLHRDRLPLRALRASLGGKRLPSPRFGLERLDVVDHFRDHPGAAQCGWSLDLDVPRFGTRRLLIEAQDDTGAWHIVTARDIKRTLHTPPPSLDSYSSWVAAHDSLTPDAADRIRARLATLSHRPLISVVMPTYNTPEKWLVQAIESVRSQLYENWELCIADDASPRPHVRRILQRYLKKDPARIKVVFRATNGHISAASNSALALAHGDFIALLDHDDKLRPHSLAEVALALDARPDLDVIYSDEDKIDTAGRRFSPYFKPDFLPDLFRAQNYLTHLAVYRATLLRDTGGFRSGFEGSQDWDLALRVIERTEPSRIHHIPKILYHWRAIPGSTALALDQKNYHVEAARRALSEHLERTAQAAELVPVPGDHWRIRYQLPTPAPLVSLLIPTRNGLHHLRRCVESIQEKTTYPNYEIVVIDNNSDDPDTLAYFQEIARRPGVRVIPHPHPFNYSAINNHAAREARGQLLALLNNDLEVITPDWLEEMAAQALRPEIGCVGAMLYYPDDRIQHAGVVLGVGGVAGHAFKTMPRGTDGYFNRARLVQNFSAVTAACLVIRKEIFDQVSGLDADNLPVAFNDVDFCLRVRAAGYRNLWTPFAEFYHHESASRGPENTPEKQARFRREVELMRSRWGATLDADPAYNPNLTLAGENWDLAVPARQTLP